MTTIMHHISSLHKQFSSRYKHLQEADLLQKLQTAEARAAKKARRRNKHSRSDQERPKARSDLFQCVSDEKQGMMRAKRVTSEELKMIGFLCEEGISIDSNEDVEQLFWLTRDEWDILRGGKKCTRAGASDPWFTARAWRDPEYEERRKSKANRERERRNARHLGIAYSFEKQGPTANAKVRCLCDWRRCCRELEYVVLKQTECEFVGFLRDRNFGHVLEREQWEMLMFRRRYRESVRAGDEDAVAPPQMERKIRDERRCIPIQIEDAGCVSRKENNEDWASSSGTL